MATSTEAPLAVLMYHEVSDRASSHRFRRFNVTPRVFDDHLRALTAAGFVPGPTGCLESASGHRAAITFDDGYASFAEVALPLLQRYGFGAMLFVPTAYVGGFATWLTGLESALPMLSWSDLRDIAAEGIEIASHGHHHAELDLLSSVELRSNLMTSKSMLEDNLGQEVTSVAYPFGYYDRAVRDMAESIGYRTGFQVGYARQHAGADPMAVPRLLVGPETTAENLIERVLSDNPSVSELARKLMRRPWRGWRAVKRLHNRVPR
jgi:peptidoglycan/xylan/chitin deacetylase (PgdA/CDA1 family)